MENKVVNINLYLNTTVGREKLCRLVQYFARFYAFYLERRGFPKATVERWSDLKQHIANGRKFFRLFKPLEFGHDAVKALSAKDAVLRATTFVKHVGNGLYYSSEVFVLTTAIGFYKPKALKEITTFGQKCWFISLFASILSSIYKLKNLQGQLALLKQASTQDKDTLKAERKALITAKDATSYQLTQDLVDIVIPSGNLGWLPVDEGIIGLAGVITSAMAMKTQWQKVATK